jgi:hypothetical protein
MTEHRLIMLLTKKYSFIILGFMSPRSASAEKKRRQRLKMSLEAKEAQREKSKFTMQTRRELETKEHKDKHNEKKRKKRQAESDEQKQNHNDKVRLTMKRKREAETEEETKWHREKNKLAKTRKRHVIKEHCHSETEEHKDDMEDVISRSKKEAMKFLHRTKDLKNPHKHRAIVCIICDRCIIGTEAIRKLTKEQISLHKKRLSVDSYKEYYETTLKPEVTKQYQINVDDFKGMLLSPRSRKYLDGYATCSVCFSGMQSHMATKRTPPKFSIANGFVIGSFPQEIQSTNKDGERVTRKIDYHELTDILKAMSAPVRPYGAVFAFFGGAQQSIRGNYQYFEMDQNRLGGVMNQLNEADLGEHIYCVLCGRMTPNQKQIVRKRSKVDTQLFIDVITWFIQESGHPGYNKISIPKDCPQPLLVEDPETRNNTDDPANATLEANYEGGTFVFSSAQDPSEDTSVYGSTDRFAIAIMNRCAPTLLASGGTYANNVEMNVKNILPFAFPFGIGGPKMKRRVQVSLELCIQVYMRLSLRQFMEGPTILVMNHIYNRQMSFKSGVMTCRSNVGGVTLGEKLSMLSTENFEKIDMENNTNNLDETTKGFLKGVATTCRSMGHTKEAAKFARRCMFAMLDYFGLNSLFLSTTPDDECSFRVRLYSKPQNWVSSSKIKTKTLNSKLELYVDFHINI